MAVWPGTLRLRLRSASESETARELGHVLPIPALSPTAILEFMTTVVQERERESPCPCTRGESWCDLLFSEATLLGATSATQTASSSHPLDVGSPFLHVPREHWTTMETLKELNSEGAIGTRVLWTIRTTGFLDRPATMGSLCHSRPECLHIQIFVTLACWASVCTNEGKHRVASFLAICDYAA